MRQLLTLASLMACLSSFSQPSQNIRLNQIGFYPFGPKLVAVVDAPNATTFTIKSVDRLATFYTGNLGTAAVWAQSGESVKIADFTSFRQMGRYVLEVGSSGYSYPFTIGDQTHVVLNKALLKAFYYNRSSTALEPQHAGKWARAGGHPDTKVLVHPSAASALRPAGTILSSPKGWYDAGDYNSYIVNSGITTYTLLLAYEQYKKYYDTLDLNIPESKNKTPDILDEIKWNLDWMLTMQDSSDGGVYNKKTSAGFSGFIMPEEDKDTRYMVTKSTSSAFDFTAVMAVAYRIYSATDPTFANICLIAAKKAYDWGIKNPNIRFVNPPAQGGYPAIITGGYGDSNLGDELEWASNELYIATKESAFYSRGFQNSATYGVPDWGNVRTLGLFSLLQHRRDLGPEALADTLNMRAKLLSMANGLLNYQKGTSPYKVAMGRGGNADFVWGSNSVAANQAMVLANAYLLTKNIDYSSAVVAQVDYLLGRNATGYCFVTGEGSYPVMNIHHRPSGADGNIDPVPGWLSGGPSDATGDGCLHNPTYLAKSFQDAEECYTKNENAINWNAPAAYITGALEYGKFFDNNGIVATDIGESPFYLGQISAFPNPASSQVTASVNMLHATKATIYLADMMGREHIRKDVYLTNGDNKVDFDLQEIPSGLYFLTVQATSKSKIMTKVVIERK